MTIDSVANAGMATTPKTGFDPAVTASGAGGAQARGIADIGAFHAYDIRGRVGENLDAAFAYALGRAYAEQYDPARVALGGDARLSSPELLSALADGLQDAGVEVWDLGLTGTEQIYHAAFALAVDGGIQVTASHNPKQYNGMKLVTRNARPIGSGTGLDQLAQRMQRGFPRHARRIPGAPRGRRIRVDASERYLDTLLSGLDLQAFPAKRVLVDAGHGAAGPILTALAQRLQAHRSPLVLVPFRATPDGDFPDGVPNPMAASLRKATIREQNRHKADLAVAFDGDFDRCFLFDEETRFVDGYYLVGYLAQIMLSGATSAATDTIVHDPRQYWHTRQCVPAKRGRAVVERTGHVFQKARMRAENAIYGGEISGHHYFREFGFCDSGMLPWLKVLAALGTPATGNMPLADWMRIARQRFPASEELNFRVPDVGAAIAAIRARFTDHALHVDCHDGLNVEYRDWRFNLRGSNTEPLLRLNIETRANADLLEERHAALGEAIIALGGQPA